MDILSKFILGLSRIVYSPTYPRKNFKNQSTSFTRDFQSLKSDWQAIGRDIQKVLVNYGRK